MNTIYTKRIIFSLVLVFFYTISNAQIGLMWAKADASPGSPKMASTSFDEVRAVNIDAAGNVYAIGSYYETSFTASGYGVGIFKFSPEGNLLWKGYFFLYGQYLEPSKNIEVKQDGVYFGATSYGGADSLFFMDNSGVLKKLFVNSSNSNNISGFVAKFDLSGGYVWSTVFLKNQNAGSQLTINDIGANSSRVYIAGEYDITNNSIITCNCSIGLPCVCTSAALPPTNYTTASFSTKCGSTNDSHKSNPFILGMNTSNGSLNSRTIADFSGYSSFTGLHVDEFNVYAIGTGEGKLMQNTTSAGTLSSCVASTPSIMDMISSDVIVFKYNTSLGNIWYGRIGGPNVQYGKDITVYNGEIFATMLNYSSTNFSFKTTPTPLSFDNLGEAYTIKIENNPPLVTTAADRQMSIDWVQPLTPVSISPYSSVSVAAGSSITTDSLGNIYTGFTFFGNGVPVYYYNSPHSGSSIPTSSGTIFTSGNQDIGFIKYNRFGQRSYVKTIGGTSTDNLSSIAANDKNVYLGGYFSGTADFDPSTSVFSPLVPLGSYDGFVARYGCFPVTINTSDSIYCFNDPVTLTANSDCPSGLCDFTYTWSDPINGGSISSTNNSIVITGTEGTNQRNVYVSNSYSGCYVTDEITMQVEGEVTISVLPATQIVCPGTSVTFTANITPSSSSIEWYDSEGILVGTGVTFSTFIPGTYIASAKNNGCVKSTNISLLNYAPFSPRVLPDNPVVCGGSGFLQIVDCPGCTYSWTAPLGSSSSSSSSIINTDIPGNYEVDIVDPNGCIQTKYPAVVNQPFLVPPVISTDAFDSPTTAICNGRPLILKSTPFASCPTCTYNWSNGSTGPYTFAFSTGVYNVTVTDTYTGCVGVSSSLLVQSSSLNLPIIDANPDKKCKNLLNNISDSAFLSVVNPFVGCNYRWYKSPSTLIGTGFVKGVYARGDYYVKARDSLGCVETSAMTYIDSSSYLPPVVNSISDNYCGPNPLTLSTNSCSGCTYQWLQHINGSPIPITGATSSTFNTNIAGSFSVSVQFANTCISKSSIKIIVSDAFTPIIAPLGTETYICNGDPIDLAVISPAPVITPPGWVYQWYLNGATITGSNGHIHTAITPGIYHVVVSRPDGCSSPSNFYTVNANDVGSNPFVVATPSEYICAGASVLLTAPPCISCVYTWNDADGIDLSRDTFPINTFSVNVSQGYYVEVRDTVSNCKYESAVFEVKDTILPTPVINVSSATNICSTTPVILSTTACSGCTYVWKFTGTSSIQTYTVFQNTYSADTTGNYTVQVIQNGCSSPFSNSVPVTRLPFNAQISGPPISSICNSDTVKLTALPDISGCTDCSYQWYRNGIFIPLPNTQDNFDVIQGGNYYAVVNQTFPGFGTTPYTFGCKDTTQTLTFTDVSVSVDLKSSALAVCGPAGQVTLEVDSCVGCSYAWFFDGDTTVLNYIPLSGANDTFFVVNGTAAIGMYKVRVTKGGCFVYDSIYLPPVPAPLYSLDTSSAPYANICGGVPITLSTACTTFCHPTQIYQWYRNNAVISGAIGQSHLAISGGNYQLIAIDGNGCVTALPLTTVTEVFPPAGFALVLDPVGVVPLTNADFDIDPYLTPISLHSVDAYSSVPQPAAIVAGDMFSPANAGSGPHLISYTYNSQNCSFVARDTIQVLSPMAVDVVNLNALAPPYESCLFDNIRFVLSNFTFAPDQILFPTSSTTFDTVTVSNAGLTLFASVYSGNINVIVPNGAVTGKVVFRNSTSGIRFQAPFFLVVQNPAVALSLNGVPQPFCSNSNTIPLSGFPSPGTFTAAYSSTPNTPVAALINTNNFVVSNVSGYDPLTGYQFLKLRYTYIPKYSNNLGSCPPVIDSLDVQVNNMKLDSIEYTPISETQSNVPLATLTRLIWPLENRNYPGNYVGTYVTGNNIQANTLPIPSNATSVNDSVFYTFTNGICSNSIGEEVTVWKRPTILDSIPLWVCQSDDPIFIGRNASGLYVTRNGTTYTSDANYVYENNQGITNGVDYSYDEKINIMTLTSSNGGLLTINPVLGADRYALVPQLISGTSTDITLTFTYNRNTDYFTEPTITTNYVIAAVTKTVNVDAPIVAQISPAILADPIFCQDNTTQQFSGIPNGGQHYLNNVLLTSNLFNPNQIVASGIGGDQDTLTYIFTGNACTDSAKTFIIIPDTFSIDISAQTGPEYCQLDAPDPIIVWSSKPSLMNNAAGVFLVNTFNSGQFFTPAQPPAQLDTNIVVYIAQDIYGCTAVDTDTFIVNPMPVLRMHSFDPDYCLNIAPFVINLYEDTIFSTNWHLQANGYSSPFQNIQVTLSGAGVVSDPVDSFRYSPLVAGTGFDTIRYTFTNTLTGCSSTIFETTFIKPLPALTLTTTGGALLNSYYCERDTIPVFATPSGGTFLSLFTDNPGGNNFDTSLTSPLFMANIPGISPDTATEIIGYTYQDPINLCLDTIRDTILIRNFTTDPVITGLPDQVCADDTIYVLTPSFGAGPAVTGVFESFWPIDSSMISTPASNVGNFNPYLSGIYDIGRDVIVIYTYASNGCTNTVYDISTLKPLPQLQFLMPGDTLFNSTDPVFHICYSANPFSMFGFNTYNGSTFPLPQDSIFGGDFYTNSGLGIVYSNIVPPGNWNYDPDMALSGLDTINFVYTSPLTGCTNTNSEPIVVDTVPDLGFAGFDPLKLDLITNHYVYCANDMPHLVIPSPFGGRTYLDYNPIPSILFELRPDTLVVGGLTTIHRITYEFISARYQAGGVCLDSTIQFIEVRPTPILTLSAAVPDHYCVADSAERLILSALPSGGVFEDITLGVVAGILGDSLFNPMAQLGNRYIIYHYTDTASGCTDTLSHTLSVYNLPEVSFETGGGCQGDTVLFLPNPAGLSSTFPAIDSITMAIWNYGDGVVDTVISFTNQIAVPNRAHIYSTTGVYFPSLTIVNQGTCDTSYMKRIVISPKFVVNDTTPYLQDFQVSPGEWFQENGDPSIAVPVDSIWEWGIASGQRITTSQESNFAWVTNLDGTYNQGDNAWVYSPCFDISTLRRPMVALDIWRDTREGVDGAIMQYFNQSTQSWKNLGIRGKGLNWYNPPYVIAAPGYQVGAPIGWSGISSGWEDARYRLDVSGGDLRGISNLRFRMAFAASPNTVIGNLEGFAFDNFYIGNRTRSVLVEHFTNQNVAGIAPIERDLYSMIYSNLYGRDVNLVQFHTEYNSFDFLHQQSIDESNSRVLFYGINNSNQVRINGQSLVNNTSDLVYTESSREIMDMQMLQDAKFKIKLYPISIQGGNMTITADVTAKEDVLFDDYALHVVVTEDSIISLQGHSLMSVVRTMREDASGTTLPSTWVAGDLVQNQMTWDFGSVTGVSYNPNNLKVVVFVQNRNTGEVYQVATSRNLNIFNGPVTIDEIAAADGKEILDLNLYPNPAQNMFNVEFNEELQGEYEWKVVDITGRILRRGIAQPGTKVFQVNTENFSPGMYIFSINNETVYAQRKVIIAK